jgi:hypothetical protein
MRIERNILSSTAPPMRAASHLHRAIGSPLTAQGETDVRHMLHRRARRFEPAQLIWGLAISVVGLAFAYVLGRRIQQAMALRAQRSERREQMALEDRELGPLEAARTAPSRAEAARTARLWADGMPAMPPLPTRPLPARAYAPGWLAAHPHGQTAPSYDASSAPAPHAAGRTPWDA